MYPNSKINEHHQLRHNIEKIKLGELICLEREFHTYFNIIPGEGPLDVTGINFFDSF